MLTVAICSSLGSSCFLLIGLSFDTTSSLRHVLVIVADVFYVSRYLALSLAPLPDATVLTRCVLVMSIAFAIEATAMWVLNKRAFLDDTCRHRDNPYYFVSEYLWAIHVASRVAYALLLLLALRSAKVCIMQQRMWRAFRTLLIILLTLSCSKMVLIYWLDHHLHFLSLYTLISLMATWLVASPRFRQHFHAWLMGKCGAVGDSAAAAAGIAGLIGNVSPEEALAQASQRFRFIDLQELSYQDLLPSSLKDLRPSICRRTAKALQGSCDAFISHSWHDCPEAKWAALQRWRNDFVAKNGREPKVWFDKCCIDQANIDVDLRCLPIFLNGCRELVVLCGTTYMSRLWCIVELCTFAHMRWGPDQIVVIKLARNARAHDDLAHIDRTLNSFDVQKCTCSQSEDQEKMLAIVGAAFGNLDRFNEIVRKLMAEAELRNLP